MKSGIRKIFITALAIGCAVPATHTFAQDTPPETPSQNTWAQYDFNMHYSGNGYTKKRRATIDNGEAIYTTSTTTSGLMLICLKDHFMVSVSLKPQDIREVLKQSTRRHKSRYVDMRLDDGEKTAIGVWTYKPSLSVIAGRKRSHAAKLYNATVRGQKVTLYMSGKKPVTLDMPKPNSVFANFGANCGIGRNKAKLRISQVTN